MEVPKNLYGKFFQFHEKNDFSFLILSFDFTKNIQIWFFRAADSSEYAVRENASTIKLFKNFKEKKTFKPDFGAEAIFGGHFLGVKSPSGLAFYDWESQELIRRIEITPKCVYWSESGDMVCITTEESYFILKYR